MTSGSWRARATGLAAAALLLLLAPNVAAAQGPTPSPAEFAAQQAALLQWLARLSAIEAPVHRAIAEASAHFSTTPASPDVRRLAVEFRPLVERLIQRTLEADAQLQTLATPTPAITFLPTEAQPATILAQVHQMNAQVRTGFQSYLSILDAAAAHDIVAVRRMMGPVAASMRTIVAFQVLVLRGQQAAVPRAVAVWDLITIALLYNQAALRIADAFHASDMSVSTAGLSHDLNALAAQLDEVASEGDGRVDAELAALATPAAMARRSADPAIETLVQRELAIMTRARGLFPLAHELAAHLRREAAAIGTRTLSIPAWMELSRSIYPFRDRLVAIDQSLAAGR